MPGGAGSAGARGPERVDAGGVCVEGGRVEEEVREALHLFLES
jgi:hypothetical protein